MAGPHLQDSMRNCQPSDEGCASCHIAQAFHLGQTEGLQEICQDKALFKALIIYAASQLREQGIHTLEPYEVIDLAAQKTNIDTFDCTRASFLTWFKTIIKRTVWREKKVVNRTIAFLEDTFANPGKGLERTADLHMQLEDVLERYLVKNKQRANSERDLGLFLMRYYEGYPASEIAERMDLTRQRVTTIINEVGEELRQLIDR